jgi:hypothetical protein
MPTKREIEALAKEMVEDAWPYDRRWSSTPKNTKMDYLSYARMVLDANDRLADAPEALKARGAPPT